jgi:hypothetical protein
MRHRQILNTAVFAAKMATGLKDPDAPAMAPLYDYCRERAFPPAETLARKWGETNGKAFPFASIAEAPEEVQVFFTVFRAVALALEPFHDGGAMDLEDLDALEMAQLDEAQKQKVQELQDMADIGRSLMATIAVHTSKDGPLKDWTPAEDPAEVVDDLVELIDALRKPEETAMPDQDKTPDSVEARTKAGQEAMDAAVAENQIAPDPKAEEKEPAEGKAPAKKNKK